MATQDLLWIAAGAATLVAIAAGLADWRRARRRNLDEVGWMPWQGIHIAAIAAALACAFFAIR